MAKGVDFGAGLAPNPALNSQGDSGITPMLPFPLRRVVAPASQAHCEGRQLTPSRCLEQAWHVARVQQLLVFLLHPLRLLLSLLVHFSAFKSYFPFWNTTDFQ